MWPFSKKIRANCGHLSRIKGKIFAFDEVTTTTIRVIDGKIDFCHRCLERMVIQCAWCGKPIFIGDPITLYTPGENYEMPDYAKIYNLNSPNSPQLIGCGRNTCADTGADYCGFWNPEGVRRVQSLLEEAMATGKIVIDNDLLGSEE